MNNNKTNSIISNLLRWRNLIPAVVIGVLGLLGLPLLWLRQRPYAIWHVVVIAFLLLWPTKWDQYLMLALAPLCYSSIPLVYLPRS